ncbi:MAG TPA: fumarate hydratase [Methanobacteriaceae archaeon]|nr:fumarate hydratase [Methanobacteriaceae archaeon]
MEINVVELVKNAVIEASTSFRDDQLSAYQNALEREENPRAQWVLEIMLENALVAKKNKVPLCDDTGVPHVLVEIGHDTPIPPNFLIQIKEGISEGLLKLPGRPMAVQGDAVERIEQTQGLSIDSRKLVPPGFLVDSVNTEGVKINILMLGGGSEIRALTRSVFHKRDHRNLFKEVVTWMRSEIPKLGCTPIIPAVGIGRTHYEASSLMLKAMANRRLDQPSELEIGITESLNQSGIGSLGLGGTITALGSLVLVGPQRASGVRIVCMRPCCSVEPRRSWVYLPPDLLE